MGERKYHTVLVAVVRYHSSVEFVRYFLRKRVAFVPRLADTVSTAGSALGKREAMVLESNNSEGEPFLAEVVLYHLSAGWFRPVFLATIESLCSTMGG